MNRWKMDTTDRRKPENWTGPLKAIRLKCLDCTCGQTGLVRECQIFTCSLWPFRLGKRPKTAGKRLYDFSNPAVVEIQNPIEASDAAGNLPACE